MPGLATDADRVASGTGCRWRHAAGRPAAEQNRRRPLGPNARPHRGQAIVTPSFGKLRTTGRGISPDAPPVLPA